VAGPQVCGQRGRQSRSNAAAGQKFPRGPSGVDAVGATGKKPHGAAPRFTAKAEPPVV